MVRYVLSKNRGIFCSLAWESLPNKRIQKSSAGNCKEKGTNIVNGSVSISGTAATNNVADMKDRGTMLFR